MDKLVGLVGGNLNFDGNSDPSEFERQVSLSAHLFAWNEEKLAQIVPLF